MKEMNQCGCGTENGNNRKELLELSKGLNAENPDIYIGKWRGYCDNKLITINLDVTNLNKMLVGWYEFEESLPPENVIEHRFTKISGKATDNGSGKTLYLIFENGAIKFTCWLINGSQPSLIGIMNNPEPKPFHVIKDLK